MPKQEMPSNVFESKAERAKREPIFHFTTHETDPKTGEKFEKKMVSVFGVELEVYDAEREGGEGTNFTAEEFDDFIADNKSKKILWHYAMAARLNHAPLIEGETDIGKTKALEYLAYLTNHKLVRISIKGTTDPSEFFGKYVPESTTAQQKILDALKHKPGLTAEVRARIQKARDVGRSFTLDDYKTLAEMQTESVEGLEKESLALFKKAAQGGRGFTRQEWEELASNEGIDLEGKMFRWQDGEMVKAMTRNNGNGYWLYVDEIGAAEPQILVALNRVMEQKRRIELSEDGGRCVEAGKDFRIFASTNPPEYAGRVPLATDFIRRWRYKKESPLSEEGLKQRLTHVMRELPFEQEIVKIFVDLLAAFHLSLRGSIKDILKKQKQKLNYEFSDLIAVRDVLRDFGYEDPLKTLRDALVYNVFGKIGDEEMQQTQKNNFETLLTSKAIPEKIQKIIEGRNPLATFGKGMTELDDSILEM